MNSPSYRPSPFTNNPTVVMPEGGSESEKTRRIPLYRWGLYVALLLSMLYAAWVFAR